VSDGCAGSGVIRSCCSTGPLTLVDGEGAGNGAGIRPFKILRSGGGLGIARAGFCCCIAPPGWREAGLELETCALATVTGATARIRTTRTRASGRMARRSIAVPRH
jgi:hypothetical protein